MIKVHYDPFFSSVVYKEDYPEFGGCGTLLQEDWENVTSDKEEVTCKKCINRFDALTNGFEAAKKAELDSMDYSQFEAYLKEHKIEYLAEIGHDYNRWFTGWISITPIESKLKKTRYFSRDGLYRGHQLF